MSWKARCHICECRMLFLMLAAATASARSRPAQKWGPSPHSTTAPMSSGGRWKKCARPSTVSSSSALRLAARDSRSTAIFPINSKASVDGSLIWLIETNPFRKVVSSIGIDARRLVASRQAFGLRLEIEEGQQDFVALLDHLYLSAHRYLRIHPVDHASPEL